MQLPSTSQEYTQFALEYAGRSQDFLIKYFELCQTSNEFDFKMLEWLEHTATKHPEYLVVMPGSRPYRLDITIAGVDIAEMAPDSETTHEHKAHMHKHVYHLLSRQLTDELA